MYCLLLIVLVTSQGFYVQLNALLCAVDTSCNIEEMDDQSYVFGHFGSRQYICNVLSKIDGATKLRSN